MRVFVGPRAGVAGGVWGAAVEGAARALAAPGGSVVSLRETGVANLSRALSAAEVALLREAVREAGEVVGYICLGTRWPAPERGAGARDGGSGTPVEVVAVTDHANLTWRSPLRGPNDDSAGPRFPSMTGVYLPDIAFGRASTAKGMIVTPGVVAGVFDDSRLNAFEAQMAETGGYAAVSSELVPVVIVAAHMGLRVAAAVVVSEVLDVKEWDRGRP